MAQIKKVYWDTCVWLALINQNRVDRLKRCEYVIAEARARRLEIWTSAITLAEAYKITAEGMPEYLPDNKDAEFESYIEQDFLTVVQFDQDLGVLARRLLRRHSRLKKPPDAMHLASAVFNNLDEFHTFDSDNLLVLNGSVNRADGVLLVICEPQEPPVPAQAALDLVVTDESTRSAALAVLSPPDALPLIPISPPEPSAALAPAAEAKPQPVEALPDEAKTTADQTEVAAATDGVRGGADTVRSGAAQAGEH